MSNTLRTRLIRLAHQQPSLRPRLLPLLTKQAGNMEEALIENAENLTTAADSLDLINEKLLAVTESRDLMDLSVRDALKIFRGANNIISNSRTERLERELEVIYNAIRGMDDDLGRLRDELTESTKEYRDEADDILDF